MFNAAVQMVLLTVLACLQNGMALQHPAQAAQPVAPQVLRLDRDFDHALAAADSPPTQSDIFRLAKVISLHLNIYTRLGYSNPTLYAKVAFSRSDLAQDIADTRTFFEGRHLTAEVLALHQRTVTAIGLPPRYPTRYYLAYGHRLGTNAQTQSGVATADGHTHIYLNLVALAQHRHWEAAVIHETIHTLQDLHTPATLLEWSLVEGIPTYLSLLLDDDTNEADALFWSSEQWQAAETHRSAILQAFAEQRHSTDPQPLQTFLRLNVPLQTVPGAPDRSGYYVGLLAVQAWVNQNPHHDLQDLFSVPPEAFWQALQREPS